jgi:site-specific DNA-cytosine methylase
VRGDPPTRRQARQEAPRGARGGATGGGIAGTVAFSFDPGQSPNPKATHQFCVEHTAPLIKERVHAVGRVAGTVEPSFVWPVEVADPITANEGATYTHEGSNFRLHNVVPSERVEPLPFDTTQVTHPANRSVPKHGDPCHPLARGGHAPAVTFEAIGFASNLGSQNGDVYTGISPTVRVGSGNGKGNPSAVAFKASHYTRGKDGAPSDVAAPLSADADKGDQDTLVAAPTLTSTNDPSRSPQATEVTQQVAAVHAATMAVRRLTPRECERLQGFPDDWTAIAYRGKPAADGPRYKALGNSMAVNVMRFIGERMRRVR